MSSAPETLTVLVVEDNPGDLRLIAEALRDATRPQFRVQAADRLGMATEILAMRQTDVVLLDMSLPDSSGLATFEAMYRSAPDIPIIVLTGQDDEELALAAVNAGAEDFLSKNTVDAPQLVRAIRYARERRRKARAVRESGVSALGTVITVIGPRGGAGKTLVAINLAAALAQGENRPVSLVDLSLQFGDLGVLLRVNHPSSVIDFVHACSARADGGWMGPAPDDDWWESVLYRAPFGADVLQAAHVPEYAELVTPAHVDALLDSLRQRSSFIVVDTSAYITDAVLRAVESADRILLVTDSNLPSIKSSKSVVRLVRMLGIPEERLLLVLNRAGAELGSNSKSVGELVGIPVAVEIPNGPVLAARTTQNGEPVVTASPHSTMGLRLAELATVVGGVDPNRAEIKRRRFGIGG